jgi:hypothetical protein
MPFGFDGDLYSFDVASEELAVGAAHSIFAAVSFGGAGVPNRARLMAWAANIGAGVSGTSN